MSQARIRETMESGQYPPYKASGIAYICFAREEKELFKLLYMRDRSRETFDEGDSIKPLIEEIQKQTGLSEETLSIPFRDVGVCPWNCHDDSDFISGMGFRHRKRGLDRRICGTEVPLFSEKLQITVVKEPDAGHRADELLHKHGLLALFYPNRRYMMEAIKTDKLTKKYKNLTAVDSLDLLVEQGELFALLGVNGAGKTTTIKMLSCLTKPTGGDAYLNGNSIVSDPAAVKNVIGVSPQETAVAPV